MSVAALSDFRAERGRFAKGHSGNPAGRPKGARNKATVLAEALLDDNAEGITRKLIEQGEAGDIAALRLLFTRIVPLAREEKISLDLAPGREMDFEEAFRVTMRALADGEISPEQAARIGRFILTGARLLDLKSRAALRASRARAAPVADQYSARKPMPRRSAAEAAAPVSGVLSETRVRSADGARAEDAPGPLSVLREPGRRHDGVLPDSHVYFSHPPGASERVSGLYSSTAMSGALSTGAFAATRRAGAAEGVRCG